MLTRWELLNKLKGLLPENIKYDAEAFRRGGPSWPPRFFIGFGLKE
jgi:hypothetical protein